MHSVRLEKPWRNFMHSGCVCSRVWAVDDIPLGVFLTRSPVPEASPPGDTQWPRAVWPGGASCLCLAAFSWYDGGGRRCLLPYSAPYGTELF